MTVKECYAALHGNYNEAKSRLMSDRLIEKFMLKFPADNSMDILRDAVKAEDYETSFRGAHTLKGVAANLAFTELQEASSELTEQLRSKTVPADPALLARLEECYEHVIKTIKEYEAEK